MGIKECYFVANTRTVAIVAGSVTGVVVVVGSVVGGVVGYSIKKRKDRERKLKKRIDNKDAAAYSKRMNEIAKAQQDAQMKATRRPRAKQPLVEGGGGARYVDSAAPDPSTRKRVMLE